ncbi:MAG: hypothetical protein B7Z55_01240, partial [Planctomycetales bacterium 12-60-4]
MADLSFFRSPIPRPMTDRFEPVFSPEVSGSTNSVGETIDDGRGRIFPCEQCGADLEFSIGQQSLQCPFCGCVKELAPSAEEIRENDYHAVLERLQKQREQGVDELLTAKGVNEVRCESCGANVVFQGNLTSSSCPYCASPLQRDKVHDASSQ